MEEHRSNVSELLTSTRSWDDLKNDAEKMNEPTSTIMRPENCGKLPDMVKLSPTSQSMSFRTKLINLGRSTQRMLPNVSKIEMVPKTKSACKVAIVFACMHVIVQENIVAVSFTAVEVTLPNTQDILSGETLDPSIAKTTFFCTPDHSWLMAVKIETLRDQMIGLVTFKARPYFPFFVTGTIDIFDPDCKVREKIVSEHVVEDLQFAKFEVCEPFK